MILWAAIIPLAMANGIVRESWLVPRLGLKWARTASGVLLSIVILLLISATVPWIYQETVWGYFRIGLLWTVCTVLFEFIFGYFIAKKPLSELARAYTFKDGDLWPVVLLVVLASPLVAAQIRGLL